MAKKRLLCPACKKALIVDDQADETRSTTCPSCKFKGIISQFPPAPSKRVKCPSCSTILLVDINRTGKVGCTKCDYKGLIGSFLPLPKEPVIPKPPPKPPKDQTQAIERQDGGHRLDRPAILTIQEGQCTPEMIILKVGRNTIGRKSNKSECSIQLDTGDSSMSRNHASIEFVVRPDDGLYEYYLSDLDSSNGTFLNGKRISKDDSMILSLNDKIRLGHTTFLFTLD